MALMMKLVAGIFGGGGGGGVRILFSQNSQTVGSGTGSIWTDEPRSKLNRMEDCQ